jgi:hypothetical protein
MAVQVTRPMMRGMALAAALMAATASTTPAFGFNAEGFQTGMTVDQVAAAMKARGLTLRSGGKGPFSAYYVLRVDRSGNPDPSGPLISLLFCEGGLVSFSHSIDFDADYIPMLKTILEQHGNPGRVTVRTQPWSGPGGGYLSSSEMYWYFGDDRVTLSFNPDGRSGKGVLRYSRGGSIGYETLNKQCPFPDW